MGRTAVHPSLAFDSMANAAVRHFRALLWGALGTNNRPEIDGRSLTGNGRCLRLKQKRNSLDKPRRRISSEGDPSGHRGQLSKEAERSKFMKTAKVSEYERRECHFHRFHQIDEDDESHKKRRKALNKAIQSDHLKRISLFS